MPLFQLRLFILYQTPHSRALAPALLLLVTITLVVIYLLQKDDADDDMARAIELSLKEQEKRETVLPFFFCKPFLFVCL